MSTAQHHGTRDQPVNRQRIVVQETRQIFGETKVHLL